ncbi:hypothetical protein CBW18_05885 [Pedobacter sp. AJM]|nr:hypothetical protein CBW18_05885 [Pedobacter sp. AJM]
MCWDKKGVRSLEAAAIKIFVAFYKKGCKPWIFVSFGLSQKKEPLGGGEPRQARAWGKIKKYSRIVKALRFQPARE